MITCPNCNKQLVDGTKFCTGCGTRLEAVASVVAEPVAAELAKTVCPSCGKQLLESAKFCTGCGAKLEAIAKAEAPIVEPTVAESPAVDTPKKKKSNVLVPVLICCIGAMVVAIAIVLAFVLFGGKSAKNNYGLYIKDDELFFSNAKNSSWQLTDNLFEAVDVDGDEIAESSYVFSKAVHMSENGKYLFFPDRIEEDDEGFNLYFKKVSQKADAKKIDSDIVQYVVNKKGNLVTYVKDGNIYQYNISKDLKDKLAKNIKFYTVSEDGKKLFYISEDGLYFKNGNKAEQKLSNDITRIEGVTKDYKAVYYIKGDNLYKHVVGKDRVKIASNVDNVLKIYDSGELYYTKSASNELSLWDFIIDDMKAIDDAMAELVKPEYPEYSNYDSIDDYFVAVEEYNVAFREYLDSMNAYYEKEARDDLRDRLKNEIVSKVGNSLCYYDGKNETVLTDKFSSTTVDVAQDKAVIAYSEVKESEFEKVMLSEIDSIYDVKDKVLEALGVEGENYVAVKGNAQGFNNDKVTSIIVNNEGTAIYYFENLDKDNNSADLYTAPVKKNGLGKAKLYDSEVYIYSLSVYGDKVIYYKDYQNNLGDLYMNKKKVDFDVVIARYFEKADKLIYITDLDNKENTYTLKVYHKGKGQTVYEEVSNFTLTNDGKILYVLDNHALFVWNNGKTKQCDDDIDCLISTYTEDYYKDNATYYK